MNMSASISDNSLLLLPLLFDCAMIGLDIIGCLLSVGMGDEDGQRLLINNKRNTSSNTQHSDII